MANMLDILGSIMISGFVLLGLFAVMLYVSDSSTNATMDNVVQVNTTNIGAIIENDFRKIGFRVPNGIGAIVAVDTSSITFLGDIDGSGSVDSVQYVLGAPGAYQLNTGPSFRPLYRIVNGVKSKGGDFGCTRFYLTYYDSLGNQTTVPSKVKQIAVKLDLRSKGKNGERIAGTHWAGRVRPMNLNLRTW